MTHRTPELNYKILLASRYTKTSISNLYDQAMSVYIDGLIIHLGYSQQGEHEESLNGILNNVWDENPVIRFLNLRDYADILLSDNEKQIVKLMQSTPNLWYVDLEGKLEPNVELLEVMWDELSELETDEFIFAQLNQKAARHLISLNENVDPSKYLALKKAITDIYGE